MMTGNGVMHNGSTVIEEYGQNLDRLQVRRDNLKKKLLKFPSQPNE